MLFKSKVTRNLVLASLFGNALGDTDVFFYIRYFVHMNERVLNYFSAVNMVGAFLFYTTGFAVSYFYLRPVDRWLGGLEGLEEEAGRRSLNYPVFAAVFWACFWAVGALFFFVNVRFLGRPSDLMTAVHISLAVLSGGTVTSVFVFFFLDWSCRRWLIPLVFEGNSPVGHPGAWQAGIRTRMTLYYLAVVVMPAGIVAGAIYMEHSFGKTSGISSSILPLTLTLCGWAIMVGLFFAFFISRSIIQPVMELEYAMEEAERGCLDHRLPVLSTDEIGRARDGFNQMLQGLKERDFIKDTFGRYVTRQVSDAVLSGDLRLGGETREVSVLLCDIRDFTSMSERISPEEVVEFLNSYFSNMVDVVIETGGTLDKFMGDAFLAVYGAPLKMDDHAERAARAAIMLRSALDRFNGDRRERGQEPVRIGIAVHTGTVVAGNIGSDKRMEYTVIGDTVNLASRIEGLNRKFGTDILISEDCFRLIEGKVTARPMAPVEVRGKREKVCVYSLEGVAA